MTQRHWPQIPGTRHATIGRDLIRHTVWHYRGAWHSYRKADTLKHKTPGLVLALLPALAIACAAIMANAFGAYFWTMAALAVLPELGFIWSVLRPGGVIYIDNANTAMLALVRKGDFIYVSDHLNATPGTDLGVRLRTTLKPTLVTKAKNEQLIVRANAAHERLVSKYQEMFPQLLVIGKAFPRGFKLEWNARDGTRALSLR